MTEWFDKFVGRDDIDIRNHSDVTTFLVDHLTGSLTMSGDLWVKGNLKVDGFVDLNYDDLPIDVDIEGGVDIKGGLTVTDTDLIDGATGISLTSKKTGVGAFSIISHNDTDTTDTIKIQNVHGTSESAITLLASAGGLDVDVATGKNIDFLCGQFIVLSNESVANAIYLKTDTGTLETINLLNSQGIDVASIALTSTVGGITLTSNLATADGINLNAVGGGVDIDSALQMNLDSAQNAADAIRINASHANGGIDVDAKAGGISVVATGGNLLLQTITTGELDLTSAGLMDVNAGANIDMDVTGTFDLLATSTFSIDGTGASNVSATSGNLTISTLTSGTLILSSIGIVDIDSATSLDILAGTTFSIDGTGNSNVTATSGNLLLSTITDGLVDIDAATGVDVDIVTGDFDVLTPSSIVLNAGEAIADAIHIHATNAAGGIEIISGTNGLNVDSTGSLDLASSYANANAIIINASAGGVNIDALAAFDVDISGGQVLISSKDNATNAIQLLTNVGVTESINITNTLGTSATTAIGITALAGSIDIGAQLKLYMDANGGIDIGQTAASVGNLDFTSLTLDTTLTMDLYSTGLFTLDSTAGISIGVTTASPTDINTTTLTIDSTSFSIDGTVASNVSTTNANLTLSTLLSGTLILDGVALVDVNAGTSFTLDVAAGTMSFDCTGAANFTSSVGDVDIRAMGASLNLISNEAVADSLVIMANSGGITIDAQALYDIAIQSGQIILTSIDAVANAISLDAINGGIKVEADLTFDLDANGAITINSAATTTVQNIGMIGGVGAVLDIGAGFTLDVNASSTINQSLATGDAVTFLSVNGLILGAAANVIILDGGTSSIIANAGAVVDFAAGVSFDIDANVNVDTSLTVNTEAVTLDQSLATTDAVSFLSVNGLTLSGTGSMDIAAGKTVNVDMNLTVNTADCTLDSNYATHVHNSYNVVSMYADGIGLNGGLTRYIGPSDSAWSVAEESHYICTRAGTVTGLYLNALAAPGGVDTADFTVMKNGGVTTMTVHFASADTTGNDTGHNFAVAIGDILCIQAVGSATCAVADLSVSLEILNTPSAHT